MGVGFKNSGGKGRYYDDLMRSYIRTDMDKSTAQKMTFDEEINNIKTTSQEVTSEMNSILSQQERLLKVNVYIN